MQGRTVPYSDFTWWLLKPNFKKKKKRQTKHLGPLQFLKEEALKLKKHLFSTSSHLPICLGYEQLRISTSCSCLQEILAVRALFAQDLSEDLLLTDSETTVVDTVLGKLVFLRQLRRPWYCGVRASRIFHHCRHA